MPDLFRSTLERPSLLLLHLASMNLLLVRQLVLYRCLLAGLGRCQHEQYMLNLLRLGSCKLLVDHTRLVRSPVELCHCCQCRT